MALLLLVPGCTGLLDDDVGNVPEEVTCEDDPSQPGCFEEFVKHVIPELQKRGIYRKEYTGATLRDHLGLKRPAIGDWRGNTDAAD